MTYDPTVPGPAQRISDTQLPIQTNFDQANTIFGLDHFEFDASSQNGKHKSVTMPDQSGTPPVAPASEMAMYARTSVGQTFPFMRRDGSGTDIPVVPIRAFGECSVPGVVVTTNSFNISSVTRLAAGQYQFNYTVAFPDTDYMVIAFLGKAIPATTNTPNAFYYDIGNKLTTSVLVEIRNTVGFLTDDGISAISLMTLRG